MRATFVESPEFTAWVSEYLADSALSELQQELLKNPNKGTVMKGCGGLRKVRVADARRGQGKRGGARIIYLYLPEVQQFYLLDIYGKDEQDDLSTADKKILAQLAQAYRATAIASKRPQKPT